MPMRSRLCPDWRDPERYFANRDELAHALRRLDNQLETSHGLIGRTTPRLGHGCAKRIWR